jgi:hypothetical protein
LNINRGLCPFFCRRCICFAKFNAGGHKAAPLQKQSIPVLFVWKPEAGDWKFARILRGGVFHNSAARAALTRG